MTKTDNMAKRSFHWGASQCSYSLLLSQKRNKTDPVNEHPCTKHFCDKTVTMTSVSRHPSYEQSALI